MQEAIDIPHPTQHEKRGKEQPAEMEYLNSRCVLFTYFQGDIGTVVDEHFSRALVKSAHLVLITQLKEQTRDKSTMERKLINIMPKKQFSSILWTNSYQAPAPACLTGVHPDFSTALCNLTTSDHSVGRGSLHQTIPPPSASLFRFLALSLSSQTGSPLLICMMFTCIITMLTRTHITTTIIITQVHI
ncbi:hypothetical protein GDO86_020110 [Hymenochirus boettgeri]|uniref:Uncharacterized protein n=1 Tax=Hymenochirus boettgeri TaxID=247094 RepID=A0A8T2IBY7_9PIPI|nr:hypothetical protein GDO86_020110 [Hymenochirus boettgeri]